MKQVYVLRHAPKDNNTDELTENGIIKARELQKILPKFNIVIASDSPRTQETATLLTGSKPTIDARAGFFQASPEQNFFINKQAESHPFGFTGAYLEYEDIKEEILNKARKLVDLIYETLERLGTDDKALIISHDITMVPAEKILTRKKPYTKTFNYLNGYIIDENKGLIRYPI